MLRLAMVGGIAVLFIGGSIVQALPADDFNDNARGSEWTLIQDDASLALSETNAHLEVLAANPVSASTDALYLSNGAAGYRLSTAADFSLAIHYSFTAFASSADGGTLGLVFGVGRDLDGTDSAAVGFGYADFGPVALPSLTVAHRTDDAQSLDGTNLAAPTSGTFLISYNAAGDDLSLGLDGAPATFTLADTVRSVWGADDLLVSFGARGNGFTTTSDQAFLDNFEVRGGTVVPEPASLGMLGLCGALLRRVRR
jgi:hypothetical protein